MISPLGVTDCLTKPVHPEKLTASMRKFCSKKELGSVFIVEDDEPSRQLMRRMLERAG
jgi:hypothetical protein